MFIRVICRDKTFSSSTLRSSRFSPQTASGPGRSDGDRYDRSRSTSHSSNSSAVSSTLQDTHGSHTHTNLKHSKSLNSLKGIKKSKRKHKHRHGKIRHSTSMKSLSDSFPPLASPFPSPSCSPAKVYVDEYQKTHISDKNIHNPLHQPIDLGPPLIVCGIDKQTNFRSSKTRAGLSEIFFDHNLPDRGKGLNRSSHSVQNSPQKEEKTKSGMSNEKAFV